MSLTLCLSVALAVGVPGDRSIATANDLRQIGLAYHQYVNDNNKGPTRAEDLGPYVCNNQRLIDLLKKEDIVFYYKVSLIQMPAGTSNTVLAYAKDVPEKGGWVLMGDGTARQMTPEEFKKAPKAGKR